MRFGPCTGIGAQRAVCVGSGMLQCPTVNHLSRSVGRLVSWLTFCFVGGWVVAVVGPEYYIIFLITVAGSIFLISTLSPSPVLSHYQSPTSSPSPTNTLPFPYPYASPIPFWPVLPFSFPSLLPPPSMLAMIRSSSSESCDELGRPAILGERTDVLP